MQCVAATERPLAGTWSGGPKAGCSRNTMPYGAGSMGRDVTDSRIRFGIGHGTEGMEKSFRVNETRCSFGRLWGKRQRVYHCNRFWSILSAEVVRFEHARGFLSK